MGWASKCLAASPVEGYVNSGHGSATKEESRWNSCDGAEEENQETMYSFNAQSGL